MKKLLKDKFLPVSIFLPYIFLRIIIELINLFTFYAFVFRKNKKTKLCIESGIQGWDLIECKEILQSAKEFIGNNNVKKISIDKKNSYLLQVLRSINIYKPSHYLVDPRTGSQNPFIAFFQSSFISILFQIYGIIPICTLTDLPVRRWRLITSIITSKRGVVISLMSPKTVSPIFPHTRLIGPLTMPFSVNTFTNLKNIQKNQNKLKKNIVFVGSLYEPRTSILNEINIYLKNENFKIDMIGSRELGSVKKSDEEYWGRLINSQIVITTSNQVDNHETDWSNINHLIYRYLEVPLCGSVLLAQDVDSLERYLKADIDYISYCNPKEAAEKILYYFNNKDKLEKIRSNGHKKAVAIVESNLYWNIIDSNLGKYSML